MDTTSTLIMIIGIATGSIPVARYLIKKTLIDIDHWM